MRFIVVLVILMSARANAGCAGLFAAEEASRQTILTALDTLLSSRDVDARVRAIDTLYGEGRQALRVGQASHGLQKALRMIAPKLFTCVFGDDEVVRRTAAFAIAGLLNMDAFPDDFVRNASVKDSASEVLVREQIEDYLVTRGAQLFQFLHLDQVTRSTLGWHVKARIEVTDELPLRLDGQAPRSRRPRWLSARPFMQVTVHANDGSVYHRFAFTGRNGRELNLRGSFEMDLPSDTQFDRFRMFVDLAVDNHALERTDITGRQVLAELR